MSEWPDKDPEYGDVLIGLDDDGVPYIAWAGGPPMDLLQELLEEQEQAEEPTPEADDGG